MRAHRRNTIIFLGILTLLTFLLGGYLGYSSRQSQVVIEWSTASELDTVGFNVYRSETPDDVGEKINEQLIPAASDPLAGGDYQFTDTSAQPGRTYYYWLEDVSASGKVGRNGPIETSAAAQMGIEWLLLVILVGTLAWGWISFLRSRPASSSVNPLAGQS